MQNEERQKTLSFLLKIQFRATAVYQASRQVRQVRRHKTGAGALTPYPTAAWGSGGWANKFLTKDLTK